MQRRRSGRLLKGAVTDQPKPKKKVDDTLNIVSRLSKKYLKNDKKTKQKQQLPPRKNLRNRSAGSIGSLSNSLNETKQSTVERDTEDLYNFDLSEESLSQELFPDSSKFSKNSKTASYAKKNVSKKQKLQSSKTKGAPGKRLTNNQSKSLGNEKRKASSAKPEKKRPFWETFTNTKPKDNGRKRRKLNSESSSRKVRTTVPKLPPKPVTSLRRQAILAKTPSAPSSAGQDSVDSGIFSSPSFILSPVPKNTSTPCNDNVAHCSSTSTPSILLAPVPEIQLDEVEDYPQYDYDSLPEVALFEEPDYDSFLIPSNDESAVEEVQSAEEEISEEPSSPVKIPSPRKSANKSANKSADKSSLMRESPVKTRVPLAEKNYGNISFSGLTEREKVEKKKTKVESFKKQKGKYDKLAEKINKQFEEFDSYELSVDDDF